MNDRNENAPRVPNSPKAELAVLSGVMLMPEALQIAQHAGLRAEHFYDPGRALIWEAMVGLAATDQPIDTVTVREWLVGIRKLARAGGDEALEKLTETIPTVAAIKGHVKIVLEKHARRMLRAALLQGAAAAMDGELEDAHEAARQALDVRTETRITLYEPRHLVQAAEDATHSRTHGIGGIKTGFHLLDPHIEHMDPGEVITVGGQSGCGKSHLLLCMALNVVHAGRKVGVLSLEDPRKRWGARLAAKLHPGLSVSIIANPQITFEQRERVEKAKTEADRIADRFRYAEAPNESIDVALEHVDALLEWGAQLLVFDHFHAMSLQESKSLTSAQVMANGVIALVRRSRRAGAVLALGLQLSQPEKAHPFKEPTMRDIKDTKQFEISSDYTILTWKPSDLDRVPIYGKIAKLKDKPNRPRFELEFADNGALFDLRAYTPATDDGEGGGRRFRQKASA